MTSAGSFNCTEAIRSCSCSRLVALAMGAVMAGLAISQARATWAGRAFSSAEAASRASRMAKPHYMTIWSKRFI